MPPASGSGDRRAGVVPTLPTSVSRPTLSPNSGAYVTSVEVTILCATAGAAIYYTTDGSIPTEASTQYTVPFTLTV